MIEQNRLLLTPEEVRDLGLSDIRLFDPDTIKMLKAQVAKVKQKLRIKNPFEKVLPPNCSNRDKEFNRGCYYGLEKFRKEMQRNG